MLEIKVAKKYALWQLIVKDEKQAKITLFKKIHFADLFKFIENCLSTIQAVESATLHFFYLYTNVFFFCQRCNVINKCKGYNLPIYKYT